MRTVDNIATEEWEQIVDEFIEREAEGFDELPADTFFTAWATLETSEPLPLPVQIRISDGQVVLSAPPDAGVRAEGNRLHLEDGRVLEFIVVSDST